MFSPSSAGHVIRAAFGQAYLFLIGFPRYAPSLACMGQEECLYPTSWNHDVLKIQNAYHDETYIICFLLRLWDPTFTALVVTDLEFQVAQLIIRVFWWSCEKDFKLQPLPWKIWAYRVNQLQFWEKLSCRNRSVLQLACLRRVKTPHHRTSCTIPCVCRFETCHKMHKVYT